MYQKYVKRWLDIILSLIALIFLSPVLMVIAIMVRVKLGSPVIFKQKRPGKDEKIFELYKFRSMTDERDADGENLPDTIRLTSFGKKLRATSLDELPELLNILKGDMSLVGPRPLLIEYLPYYSNQEQKRHLVRPGLTGLAQISGRNYIGWNERLGKDVEYINKISFRLDCKIVLFTVKDILFSKNVATDTSSVETNLAEERQSKIIKGHINDRENYT